MNYSTDFVTGTQVQNHLVREGVETPFEIKAYDPRKVENLFAQMMVEFGLDLHDDSLCDTPRRVAKLYGTEYFAGLNYANFPTATVVENKMHADEIVLERNIQVRSMCEHHFLPITGSAFVAYIPEKKVLGLSKINRIVDFFCRRPQIQERLTMQIYHALAYILDTPNVAVLIQAEHLCVKTRGVEDPCSDTVTCKLDGVFKQADKRAEFIALCKGLTSH
jgi:GTP cyclohydrolase IA